MSPLDRAKVSLDGLSVGDAFGQMFFGRREIVAEMIEHRAEPKAPWYLTDDSIMAIAIVETLEAHGRIDQDDLARRFASGFRKDPLRGYGGMAIHILQMISEGADWRQVAPKVFDGSGSFGNGAAMRIAPLGAYFADDLERLVVEAIRSAEVTHAHPEGIAGAVAVALAAAWAWLRTDQQIEQDLFDFVLQATPTGETREGIVQASELPADLSAASAVQILGNGSKVSAQDTVPFVLWSASKTIDNFEEALWQTVSGLGDRDTTCAMVGGIVGLRVGHAGIPTGWLESRESLHAWASNDPGE